MEIRYPNYYKKFQCIAGACPDTCCAGWEIAVDPASEKRYQQIQRTWKKTNPAFVKKLKTYIKNGYILSEDVTCPFLNKEGLCEMYMEMGPEALCHTCKRHPRHMEDYGNLHEILLLMSCPEVARLILEENDGSFYIRDLPERHGNMDGINEELLTLLLETRERIWNVLESEKTGTLEEKMAFFLALGHDIQRRIIKEDYADAGRILERYSKEGAFERFLSRWIGYDDRKALMEEFLEDMETLDTICRSWPSMIEACKTASNGRIQDPHLESGWTHVFRYFLYSFMLTALYDQDVLTKIKMAVLCTMLIIELDLTDRTEGKRPDQVTHCYVLARQVENSDENRRKLEQFLKQKKYSARRIIDALL